METIKNFGFTKSDELYVGEKQKSNIHNPVSVSP